MPLIFKKNKNITILILSFIFGLLCKFYYGPFYKFFNYNLAGFFYVLFWISLFLIILPNNKNKIIMIVLLTTIFLEFTQLLDLYFLNLLRKNFIIRALIGSTFSFLDIPFYFAAAIFAFLFMNDSSSKT